MKKIFYSLTLLAVAIATLTITACSKSETFSLAVPAKGIIVSMPGDSGTTTFDSANITSITTTSVPKGWTVNNIDMYSSTITVTAPSREDLDKNSAELNGTLSLKGYTPTGNTKNLSIHLAIVENVVDYSTTPANCYVATQPDTRYIFDPTTCGNKSNVNTVKVQVIWETTKDLIQYLDIRDGKASFYIAGYKDEETEEVGVKAGNALVGGYDDADNLLWSWHIWVTKNDPMATENTITIGGATLMNMNLGAECNSNGSTDTNTIFNSYGLYYQWGRKEPFVGPTTFDFDLNNDHTLTNYKGSSAYIDYVESTASEGTLQWATDNPLSIIKGHKDNDYDWMYNGHDNTLWSTTAKTENDPCPAGWRVPDASVYANLTIATTYDEMAWETLQPQYGIMLTDTETAAEHFFTAQGRRNYLDCRLDIINDDEVCPIPWSGYYWTATTDGGDASAMFFDLNTATRTWNGFDAKRAMHRANALPVRCVKE
ncbi:MAG: hypothetical protein IKY50_02775 [Alistipes sp.]|nr:hypothetical protein [Alistipes sp.]